MLRAPIEYLGPPGHLEIDISGLGDVVRNVHVPQDCGLFVPRPACARSLISRSRCRRKRSSDRLQRTSDPGRSPARSHLEDRAAPRSRPACRPATEARYARRTGGNFRPRSRGKSPQARLCPDPTARRPPAGGVARLSATRACLSITRECLRGPTSPCRGAFRFQVSKPLEPNRSCPGGSVCSAMRSHRPA